MTEETTTRPYDGFSKPDDILAVSEHVRTADGAEYVHKDLVKVVESWAVENHISPPSGTVKLGDTSSFAEYVKEFGHAEFVSYDELGMKATLDYHDGKVAGRCQWNVERPFTMTPEWQEWTQLLSLPQSQKDVIEFIEDHSDDIDSPGAADLANMLRVLRVNRNSEATTTVQSDGSTDVAWSQSSRVNEGVAKLPASIKIRVPILEGETDERGKRVKYLMTLNVRPTIADDKKLLFRFSMPNAQATLTKIIDEQVADLRDRLKSDKIRVYRLG